MVIWLMKHVARLPLRFPWAVVLISLALTVLAGFFLPRLYVSTDRNLLAGEDNESFKHRERVNDLFGTSLTAVAVVYGRKIRLRSEKRRTA